MSSFEVSKNLGKFDGIWLEFGFSFEFRFEFWFEFRTFFFAPYLINKHSSYRAPLKCSVSISLSGQLIIYNMIPSTLPPRNAFSHCGVICCWLDKRLSIVHSCKLQCKWIIYHQAHPFSDTLDIMESNQWATLYLVAQSIILERIWNFIRLEENSMSWFTVDIDDKINKSQMHDKLLRQLTQPKFSICLLLGTSVDVCVFFFFWMT